MTLGSPTLGGGALLVCLQYLADCIHNGSASVPAPALQEDVLLVVAARSGPQGLELGTRLLVDLGEEVPVGS